MLVVAVGLPRFLWLCSHPGGHTHLEIARTHELCCADDDAAVEKQAAHDGGSPVLHGGDATWDHIALGTELGTSQRWRMPPDCAAPALHTWPDPAGSAHETDDGASRRPPPTGPPRIDARTARIVSTVLRR